MPEQKLFGIDKVFSLQDKRVWVTGQHGLVGSAMVRRLASEPCSILTVERSDVDLRDQAAVDAWVDRNRPDAVVLAAAKVGGILANNSYPADFFTIT